MFGGLFNKAPQQESFKGKDPEMFEMLKESIRNNAISFDKLTLVEDPQELERLTERVARALTTGGETIDAEVLSSDKFRETLARALQVTPAAPTKEGYMTVDAQGNVVATAETKPEIVHKIQAERQETDLNNQ
jgi:hypothetical protein